MNWEKIQFKVWQISKTPTVTKFNNSNCDKIQQLLFWQNSKTQILIKRTFSDKVFLKEQLDYSTTDEMYLMQPFAILWCFLTFSLIPRIIGAAHVWTVSKFPSPPTHKRLLRVSCSVSVVVMKHCQVGVQKEYFWTSFSNHREVS